MNPGKLRHTIEIKYRSEVDDNIGGETETLVKRYGSVRASIEPVQGREPMVAKKLEGNITHKVKMRYRSGISSKDQIVFGTRIFEIDSVINVEERNRELILLCIEKT